MGTLLIGSNKRQQNLHRGTLARGGTYVELPSHRPDIFSYLIGTNSEPVRSGRHARAEQPIPHEVQVHPGAIIFNLDEGRITPRPSP